MRGSKPTDALRTLPERAFRLRARLIAVGLCAVCFAGLIGRLFWLQLCTGGWYTQRALGQQLRDTVVPADRGYRCPCGRSFRVVERVLGRVTT